MGQFKYYLDRSVHDAARERVAFLFDEFENIAVNFSGGKDSTVIFYLMLDEATKRGRLPLKVLFIDQECEWECTVDYVRSIMNRPDVEAHWLQVPFQLFNGTSNIEEWLTCWEPGREADWMRPKEPNSIHENIYGVDRFTEIFTGFLRHHWPEEKACLVGGVRTEESPARMTGLTHYACYKWVTWGNKSTPGLHFTFYPIFDWSWTDVWKFITANGLPYNPLYDYQYRYGVAVKAMRVSSLSHETAIQQLWWLQEIEPRTYAKLVARLSGIDMAAKMGKLDYFPKKLPFMFRDWAEYRDYLLEHLAEPPHRETMRKQFERQDMIYGAAMGEKMHKVHVRCILTGDYHFTHLNVLERGPEYVGVKRAWDQAQKAGKAK